MIGFISFFLKFEVVVPHRCQYREPNRGFRFTSTALFVSGVCPAAHFQPFPAVYARFQAFTAIYGRVSEPRP